jgi:hypothetical protein
MFGLYCISLLLVGNENSDTVLFNLMLNDIFSKHCEIDIHLADVEKNLQFANLYCFYFSQWLRLRIYLYNEHEFVVGAMQKFDAKFFEEKPNGKRRTSLGVDVTRRLSILRNFDRTLLLVEINLRKEFQRFKIS